jgi:hypothetical protein
MNGWIDIFLPNQSKGRHMMSSVPQELLGIWTIRKTTEEAPWSKGTFTLFDDVHYEYEILSGEGAGPVGEPSYGALSHQQKVTGTFMINGSYIILHPIINLVDGRKIQTDYLPDAKYVWQIVNLPNEEIIVLKLVGADEGHVFYRNMPVEGKF